MLNEMKLERKKNKNVKKRKTKIFQSSSSWSNIDYSVESKWKTGIEIMLIKCWISEQIKIIINVKRILLDKIILAS